MSKILNPILRYYGGKWRLAPWIISYFPRHRVYVEPYCGAASVLLRKPRSKVEVLNDRHERLVSLFRVLRNPITARQLRESLRYTPCAMTEYMTARECCPDPIEDARRMIILGQQAHGSTGASGKKSGWRRGIRRSSPCNADCWARIWKQVTRWSARLRHVYLESDEALRVIERYDNPDTLFYIDPPYLVSTRRTSQGYTFDLSEQDHRELAAVLHSLQGMVVVSGYASSLYMDELYKDWHVVAREALTDKSRFVTEYIWMNFDPYQVDTPRFRQQAGARATHLARSDQTATAIQAAISQLTTDGHRVTRKAVAAMVGISREHIGRRYGHLFEK